MPCCRTRTEHRFRDVFWRNPYNITGCLGMLPPDWSMAWHLRVGWQQQHAIIAILRAAHDIASLSTHNIDSSH